MNQLQLCIAYATTRAVFLKNKLAIIFVHIFIHEFPDDWPTFFGDISSFSSDDDTAIDTLEFFLRVLHIMHEDVVDRQFSRDQKELVRNSNIKDAMRVHSMPFVAEVWHHVLATYADSNLNLVNICLNVISQYIDWIDIDLIVNDKFCPLFFRFLQSPSQLQANACQCITAIVEKGMETSLKIQLLKSMSLVDVLVMLVPPLELDDCEQIDDVDFVMNLAVLTGTVGNNLLSAVSSKYGVAALRQYVQFHLHC
jgi:exportin-T